MKTNNAPLLLAIAELLHLQIKLSEKLVSSLCYPLGASKLAEEADRVLARAKGSIRQVEPPARVSIDPADVAELQTLLRGFRYDARPTPSAAAFTRDSSGYWCPWHLADLFLGSLKNGDRGTKLVGGRGPEDLPPTPSVRYEKATAGGTE